jgi:cell division protein FtsB
MQQVYRPTNGQLIVHGIGSFFTGIIRTFFLIVFIVGMSLAWNLYSTSVKQEAEIVELKKMVVSAQEENKKLTAEKLQLAMAAAQLNSQLKAALIPQATVGEAAKALIVTPVVDTSSSVWAYVKEVLHVK